MDKHLQVYFDSACITSKATLELIASVRNQPLGLSIEVVDLFDPDNQVPKTVFALPTFILNGAPIILGNPTLQNLIDRLAASESGIALSHNRVAEDYEHSKTRFSIHHGYISGSSPTGSRSLGPPGHYEHL